MADLEITHAGYDAANDFAQTQWPAYNEARGIVWRTESFGVVARSAGAVVGALTFHITGGVAHFEQLIVVADRRGEGIGSRLLAAGEAVAAERGCHMMELETADFGPWRLYARCGWKIVAEKRRSKFGATWYWMQKEPATATGS